MNTIKIKKDSTRLVAHRGLSGIEAENTNAAFVAAGNRSYYGIETDIHRTSDGRFVVCHDGDLNRIAGVDMAVEDTDLSRLQEVVLLDKDGRRDREDLRSIISWWMKHSVQRKLSRKARLRIRVAS